MARTTDKVVAAGLTDPMTTAPEIEAQIEALHLSDQRAIRSVDSLADAQWAEPSLLPGWTRAHVVAHLALNAEGFARALEGVLDGQAVPVYDPNEARDPEIERLAAAEPGDTRDRYYSATQHFRTIARELHDEHWAGTILRLPTGPEWPTRSLIPVRRQEVEVHHADLGVAYTHASWPPDFSRWLLNRTTTTHADSPETDDFTIRATDLDDTWHVGADAPVITGTAADLAWWLIGRGNAEGLSPAGQLPAIGSWQGPAPQGR